MRTDENTMIYGEPVQPARYGSPLIDPIKTLIIWAYWRYLVVNLYGSAHG